MSLIKVYTSCVVLSEQCFHWMYNASETDSVSIFCLMMENRVIFRNVMYLFYPDSGLCPKKISSWRVKMNMFLCLILICSPFLCNFRVLHFLQSHTSNKLLKVIQYCTKPGIFRGLPFFISFTAFCLSFHNCQYLRYWKIVIC